ncbi:MAG: hypothetical protein AAGN46_08815 [Acidobacteriota bacterium]
MSTHCPQIGPNASLSWFSLLALGVMVTLGGRSFAFADDGTAELEVDHVFVVVERGAEDATTALRGADLAMLDEVRTHEGQGTASRFVFFDSTYLELIWREPDVALGESSQDVADRLGASGCAAGAPSPFGVALRRITPNDDPLPAPTTIYRADWMPADAQAIEFFDVSDAPGAVFLFYVPPPMAVTGWKRPPSMPPAEERAKGPRRMTGVRVTTSAEVPPVLAPLGRDLELETGDDCLLELTFDDGATGRVDDLRPVLPVILRR